MAEIKQIDTPTLVSWLEIKKEFTILDIRPQSERTEWQIPESIYINAYDELKSGNENALDVLDLDKSKTVITVCTKGRLSLFAAEILDKKGYEAYSLEGGMSAWNYAYDTQTVSFDNFKIIQVRRLAKGCLSYIIGSGNEAMVIDSSLNPSIYKSITDTENWKIKFVTDTHIHADYISRTKELSEYANATHLFNASATVSYPFTPIEDNEIVHIGNVAVKTLFTQGHTIESTSFIIDDKAILTGDTLFINGIGRPDLKADENEVRKKSIALFQSLQKIMSLDIELLVMPAHFSSSIQVGQKFITEKLQHLKEKIKALSYTERDFINNILENLPPTPPNYLTISEINKVGQYENYVLADLEAGANRCAIS